MITINDEEVTIRFGGNVISLTQSQLAEFCGQEALRATTKCSRIDVSEMARVQAEALIIREQIFVVEKQLQDLEFRRDEIKVRIQILMELRSRGVS